MARETYFNPTTEWLDQIKPIGLVLAPFVLHKHDVIPPPQSQKDNDEAALAWARVDSETAADRAWRFCSTLLNWPADKFAGAPNGQPNDALPHKYLPELSTTLSPDFGLLEPDASGWRLLVQVTDAKAEQRGALEGWEATPRQRLERLLRDTGTTTGLLFAADELILMYAPKGETSGWMMWPLTALGGIAGRPLLGGLKATLSYFRLMGDAPGAQLPALLKQSREAQAEVSTKLSGQILKALHELMRGLDAAWPEHIRHLAQFKRDHLYEGILTNLLRLVFVLYAEDRDLLPSSRDEASQRLYTDGYGLRGLHERLTNDAGLFPDTMEERKGGWGQLLALFRLIHNGHGDWITGRGGKLFDPDAFPFLEGRETKDDAPRVLTLSDACVKGVLDALMMLETERLSYRTLDVEQIGSVYETVMGFEADLAKEPMIAIKGGKGNKVPVFVGLETLLANKDRVKAIDEVRGTKLTAKQSAAVKAATDIDSLIAAFGTIIDERGSPKSDPAPKGSPVLQPTDERRRSGSHYTPRSLTAPIVEKALEPILRRMGDKRTPEQILALKVCDPAMGSGAFLVEACRALAGHLTRAWEAYPGTRPTLPPDEDELLHAKRLVATRCLYGVDRNPMAVDLARLSVWLETLARDHEFTFLDHALKAGDSLVGLSREQIQSATWDTNHVSLPLIGYIVRQRFEEAAIAREEIRNAADDTSRAILEQKHRNVEVRIDPVRRIGDAIIACWFAEDKDKARRTRLGELESWVSAATEISWQKIDALAATLNHGPHPIRPFHWEIEFPEVFARDNAGFDAFVGNPPFAGKNTIADGNRTGYGKWLQELHTGSHGNADLVAHFFRRAYGLLREDGSFGLIATNTIAQGDTRESGLRPILADGGTITATTRRLKWPGEAAVVVSVVHVLKGTPVQGERALLDGIEVDRVSAYLVEGNFDQSPASLKANEGKAFQGSIILGMGFTFDDADTKGVASPLSEMHRLIAKDPRNAERIKPCIGGDESSNSPRHEFFRYIIDFEDFPLTRNAALPSWTNSNLEDQKEWLREGVVPPDYPGSTASDWPDLLEIVHRTVRPIRLELGEGSVDKVRKKYWWQYASRAKALYEKAEVLEYVLANTSKASPHHAISRLRSDLLYTQNLNVFAFSNFAPFCSIHSRVHEIWARSFGTTMKDDFTYAKDSCFATFPFPENYETDPSLEAAGQAYHDHRAALMVAANEGMTKTYNRFHKPTEKSAAIATLRTLHAAMDDAVLRAYNWHDLADEAQAQYLTEATEPEYAYQNRLFWPAPFRDQVLSRLLDLNKARAADEKAEKK
jgi:N-6 DNA Methylase